MKGKVVGDLPLAKKVQIQQQGRPRVVDYPVWVGLTKEFLNGEDLVTAQISNIMVASAGILKKKDDANTEFTTLMQTDDAAMQIDASRLAFMPDVESLLKNYQPEGEPFTVAARITGKVKTAFPDGKPKVEKSEEDSTNEETRGTPNPQGASH